ncbi:protein FAM161A [Lampris incognitus]|uniref:protein FAM161A n=1 Tax=Lampris incognitus TaxID=2546036 RepID=UPI0024B4A352|nr:protein FAM161A [Lampris incognitus]
MSNAHRTNVLVTSCLKTPVDPHTKVPLASYERQRALPSTAAHMDNRHYEKEMECEDSGSEFSDGDLEENNSPLMVRDHINLHEIFSSNEEYYSKLEELKKAHLRTMAELEGMYRKKLQLKCKDPIDMTHEAGHRLPWAINSPSAPRRLRKYHSAMELRRGTGQLNSSDEEGAANDDVEKGLLSSPKEHIKNMWKDFKLSPLNRHLSCSSLQSLPGNDASGQKHPNRKGQKRQLGKDTQRHQRKHRMTIPKPFQMTLREAEKQRRGIKTRSEIELENAELRRQLEELTECQKKFRASPMPAHVHLPLYEELLERDEERRRATREGEGQHPGTIQKPFSFLEREQRKKEQKEEQLRQLQSSQEKVKPFKAKPVPRAVYATASGEQMKEEQLYRSIKMQMRAKEMLSSSSMPPSMLTRRLSERKKTNDTADGNNTFSHSPKIKRHVPDFDASYRRFQMHLESRKEVRPVTACEPFQLRTSHISSHRERILADIEKEQTSPRMTRWPHLNSSPVCTPNSSLCSSLSGSLELLPAKVTDATKKRQEAVRKVLEQRKKAAEEEESWRERQRQRERKLQKVVLKRAQANDPHLALSQTNQAKLKEFRKQDLQRRKEYQQEIKEIRERVKGRPLLLEQVAQRNAKQAAEKRYVEALRGCGLTEDSISSKVPKSHQPDSPRSSHKASVSSHSRPSDKEEHDTGHTPVHYRKVYLDEEDLCADSEEREDPSDKYELDMEESEGEDVRHYTDDDEQSDDRHDSDDSYHYSDDHENYSDNSEQDSATEDREQDGDLASRCHSRHSDRSQNSQGSDRDSREKINKASDE